MATFNISDLFTRAFGYSAPPGYSIEQAPDPEKFSSLGQAYYKNDQFGREIFMPVKVNGYMLHVPIIGYSVGKRIVETDMPERDGTVNEMISRNDYIITVKGIIVRPDNTYPEREVQELDNLFRLNEALEMRSALTDIILRGDDRVILKSYQFPEMAGVEHAKAYSMEFKSDRIFTLEID